MNDEQQKVIDELRKQGYAIAIFTPDELKDSPVGKIEDIMVERGWHGILYYNEVV